MSSSLIVSIIAGLIVLSLIVSAISYSRQQAITKRNNQIRKLRQSTDEMLTHVKLLLVADPHYQLILLFQHQIVDALTKAYNLNPQDPQVLDDLNTQKAMLNKYKEHTRNVEAKGYFTSDNELSQAQFHLSQIAKAVDISLNKRIITKVKSKELNEHIVRLKLDIDVNSHLKQAERYGKVNDMVMYQLHIKQAREALKKTKLEFDDKNNRIRELTEILNESKKTNKVVEDMPLKTSPEVESEEKKKY